MAADDGSQALFVYGTLVEAATREQILGHRVEAIEARLPGFVRDRSRYYYLARKDGAETAGLILMGLSDSDFRSLDKYEEVPHLYTREIVEAITPDGPRRCWVYLPTSWASR